MWKSITVLMGPPGAGKTTLGSHAAKSDSDTFFISVGEYMREVLQLEPPFKNVDRQSVFKSIIFETFAIQGKKNLIIDCNPFPYEMRDAVFSHLELFKKKRFIIVDAPRDILMQRLLRRNRKDQENFSSQQRIDYYKDNVFPEINKLVQSFHVEYFCNDNLECINKFPSFLNKKYE